MQFREYKKFIIIPENLLSRITSQRIPVVLGRFLRVSKSSEGPAERVPGVSGVPGGPGNPRGVTGISRLGSNFPRSFDFNGFVFFTVLLIYS